jgi:general secretion pathway protein I
LLAELPARNLLKVGRQSGELAGHLWRIDVTAMDAAEDSLEATAARFVPLAVNMRVVAPGGGALQITTVRLVPRGAE